MYCMVTEKELKICEYALRNLIKEYPKCSPEFIQLQKKLEKHGFRDSYHQKSSFHFLINFFIF